MSIHIHSEEELLTCLNNYYVIIKFSAEWCGPCKVIEPFYNELAKNNPNVCFLSIDVDECENIAQYYNVTGMPTFVGVANKQEIGRFAGAVKDKLESLLMKVKQI